MVAVAVLSVLQHPNGENPQESCKDIALLKNKSEKQFAAKVREALRGRSVMGKSYTAKDAINRACPKPGKGAYIFAGKDAEI